MATAKKLPSGSYRVNLFIGIENGKRNYKSFTADTKKEAEFAAAQYAVSNKKHVKSADITLSEAYSRYISSKTNVLSPATVREYTRSANNDLKNLMPLKLDRLTQELIQNEINEESKTHKPKSVRNMHGLLSAVLSVYMPNFKLNTTLPQKTKSELYVPSNDDIQALLKSVEGTEIEKAIMLAAFGSLRRSEIAALKTSDIKGNTITISKAVVLNNDMEWVEKPPKTFAGYRTIELPQFVIDKISKSEDKVVNYNPEEITRHFVNAVEKCELNHFRFHDLRHYQASILHAMGVPDKYIIARGGWKTESTLKKIYQHTMDEKRQEVEKDICNYFTMQHEMQHDNK